VGSGSSAVHLCRNQKQLLGAYLLNDDKSIILEKYISGQESTTDVYCDRSGAYVASCSRKRLSVNDGEIFAGSIDENRALTELARTLSGALPMRGPFNFQTIEEPSGEIYLIEINTRLSGGSTFSIAAGWDLPGFILDEFSGQPIVSQGLRNRLQMVRYTTSFYWEEQ
jgi:carbamoyl-phosphate synthase large subunit